MKSYRGHIPNKEITDYQRDRVYHAESQCKFWKEFIYMTAEDVKELIQAIAEWGGVRTPVVKLADQECFEGVQHEDLWLVTRAEPIYSTKTKIVLPFPVAQSLPIICHEMAHCLNYNSDNPDHHGPYFCGMYLQIVKQFICVDEYLQLRTAFQERGVSFKIAKVKV